MRTVTLAALFIALLASPAQAENCLPQKEVHQALYASGHVVTMYGQANEGFAFSLWLGPNGYVLLLENSNIACIAATGDGIYVMTEWPI